MTTPLRPETTADRVLRQARTGRLDEDRLLPPDDKRARDVSKKLDRLAAGDGWYKFVAGAAHTMATGKVPQRRNAEVSVVTEITRWRREVGRFAPDRLGEFEQADSARHGAPGRAAAAQGFVMGSRRNRQRSDRADVILRFLQGRPDGATVDEVKFRTRSRQRGLAHGDSDGESALSKLVRSGAVCRSGDVLTLVETGRPRPSTTERRNCMSTNNEGPAVSAGAIPLLPDYQGEEDNDALSEAFAVRVNAGLLERIQAEAVRRKRPASVVVRAALSTGLRGLAAEPLRNDDDDGD